MLNFLDTLIGFASVMLGASLIVTILNQAISGLLAHRGGNLLWGLRTLFRNIGPGKMRLTVLGHFSSELAELVVTHPLISDSLFSTAWASLVQRFPVLLRIVRRWQFATAIQVPELREVLQHIADNRPAGMTQAQHRLLGADIRALLGAGTTLEDWFTAMEDRIKQRFTMWMRMWTVLFALFVAVFGWIDSLALIHDLSTQSKVRSTWAAAAPQMSALAKEVNQAESKPAAPVTPATPKPATPAAPSPTVAATPKAAQPQAPAAPNAADATPNQSSDELKKILDTFAQVDLDGVGLKYRPRPMDPNFMKTFPGVLISWLLICLGSPFWFNALGSLTSLRPVTASKI